MKMRKLANIHWKADNYRTNPEGRPSGVSRGFGTRGGKTLFVEASPGARWKRLKPFDLYRPSEGGRDAEAGPHLTFLRLKRFAQETPRLLEISITMFVERYGLLGVFQSIYLPEPALPKGKLLVAPEAVLERSGTLRKVDPATDGVSLLVTAQEELGLFDGLLGQLPRRAWSYSVAQPEEARFIAPGKPGQSRKVIPWQKVRQEFGGLFVLTEAGISLVCTREPLLYWEVHLENFPTPEELLGAQHIRLPGVETVFAPDEDGYLHQGWTCDSLLSAMRLMLCLDLSGESTVQKCGSLGCPNYFRAGPYSRARYCSSRCASRASTRMARDQEP